MEPVNEAKRLDQTEPAATFTDNNTLDRVITALQKANELMERHLAAGELTVPARALFFILRDAGFGNGQNHRQELKQPPRQEQSAASELHRHHGIRR
jgi:hypothetical protein